MSDQQPSKHSEALRRVSRGGGGRIDWMEAAADEIVRLRALVADLTYEGFDRGYTRRSEVWRRTVRVSAAACGLTCAQIRILTGEADED